MKKNVFFFYFFVCIVNEFFFIFRLGYVLWAKTLQPRSESVSTPCWFYTTSIGLFYLFICCSGITSFSPLIKIKHRILWHPISRMMVDVKIMTKLDKAIHFFDIVSLFHRWCSCEGIFASLFRPILSTVLETNVGSIYTGRHKNPLWSKEYGIDLVGSCRRQRITRCYTSNETASVTGY